MSLHGLTENSHPQSKEMNIRQTQIGSRSTGYLASTQDGQRQEKQGRTQELSQFWRLRRHSDEVQCDILDCILGQKEDIHGKAGEI